MKYLLYHFMIVSALILQIRDKILQSFFYLDILTQPNLSSKQLLQITLFFLGTCFTCVGLPLIQKKINFTFS